jgi:hypothetical protein
MPARYVKVDLDPIPVVSYPDPTLVYRGEPSPAAKGAKAKT